jgi:porin-like protein
MCGRLCQITSVFAALLFWAQGADAKAPPAPPVPICSLYGEGFYYVPGTDTCIKFTPVKIGSYVRVDCFTNYSTGIIYTATTGGGTVPGSQPTGGWNISTAIEHYWTPSLRTSVLGSGGSDYFDTPRYGNGTGGLGGSLSRDDYNFGRIDGLNFGLSKWGALGNYTGNDSSYGGGSQNSLMRQGLNYRFNNEPRTNSNTGNEVGDIPSNFIVPGTWSGYGPFRGPAFDNNFSSWTAPNGWRPDDVFTGQRFPNDLSFGKPLYEVKFGKHGKGISDISAQFISGYALFEDTSRRSTGFDWTVFYPTDKTTSLNLGIAQAFADFVAPEPVPRRLYEPSGSLFRTQQTSDQPVYEIYMGFAELLGAMLGGARLESGEPPPPMILGLDQATIDSVVENIGPDVVPVVGDLGGPFVFGFNIGAIDVSPIPAGANPPDAQVNVNVASNSTGDDGPKNADSKGKGPSPVTKPPIVLKLFTNKPALPVQGKPRPQTDVGFDQNPAECLVDPNGKCTMTVVASERRFYGLAGGSPDYTVNLAMPFATSIVWREPDGAQPATTESIRQRMPALPPEVRAKTRSFSIGDKKFSQAMIEASTFNPSPDRWKDYLGPAPAPAGKSKKRSDKGGGPMDSFAQGYFVAVSDPCGTKEPAAYVEGEPMVLSGTKARDLPEATIHLGTIR